MEEAGNAPRMAEQPGKGCHPYVCTEEPVMNTDVGNLWIHYRSNIWLALEGRGGGSPVGKRLPHRGSRKSKGPNLQSAVCSALGTCGLFHFPFMLIQCFRPPYLPRTIDLLVFTPHYHLFSLYFHLNFLFLEGRREVMNINVLDLKRGMINYDL